MIFAAWYPAEYHLFANGVEFFQEYDKGLS